MAESLTTSYTTLFRFLVICDLLNIAEQGRLVGNIFKRAWKKQSKSDLRYYSGISLEKLEEIKETQTKDSTCSRPDSS